MRAGSESLAPGAKAPQQLYEASPVKCGPASCPTRQRPHPPQQAPGGAYYPWKKDFSKQPCLQPSFVIPLLIIRASDAAADLSPIKAAKQPVRRNSLAHCYRGASIRLPQSCHSSVRGRYSKILPKCSHLFSTHQPTPAGSTAELCGCSMLI